MGLPIKPGESIGHLMKESEQKTMSADERKAIYSSIDRMSLRELIEYGKELGFNLSLDWLNLTLLHECTTLTKQIWKMADYWHFHYVTTTLLKGLTSNNYRMNSNYRSINIADVMQYIGKDFLIGMKDEDERIRYILKEAARYLELM